MSFNRLAKTTFVIRNGELLSLTVLHVSLQLLMASLSISRKENTFSRSSGGRNDNDGTMLVNMSRCISGTAAVNKRFVVHLDPI